MTVREILAREAQVMGRPCKRIDYARLKNGVVTVVYSCELDFGNLRQTQVRVVTYENKRQISSGIVKTFTNREES